MSAPQYKVSLLLKADASQMTPVVHGAGQSVDAFGQRVVSATTTAATGLQNVVTQAGRIAPVMGESGQAVATLNINIAGLTTATRASAQAQDAAAESQNRQQSAAQSFLGSLREQIAVYGKNTDGLLRYRAAQLGVGQEASSLILQFQNQRAAQASAAQAAQAEAQAQREAAQAKQAQATAQASFLTGLREQVAVQGLSTADTLRYRAAQLGVTQEASGLIDALAATNKGHGAGAISAAQQAQALRMLPAQFTDIATSVASGMPIWMVAIQQGGQIKDSFGGAGAAARELGRYAIGLIGPLTATAAAAALLAAGAYAGSAESRALQNAIINSGNAAGVTQGQLMGMAVGVDAVVGTQGRAVEVLEAFVATGRVGAAHMEEFTTAAIRFESVGGAAAEETAKSFAELGKSPLEASLKLNDSMGYLTASTYEQIKALTEQGRHTEAADVAQKAFADTLNSRSSQMEANLGLVEKAWKGIKWAVTETWDAIKGIGRDGGAEGLLKSAQKALDDQQAQVDSRKARGLATGDLEPRLAAAKALVEVKKEEVQLLKRGAAAQAEHVKTTQQLVAWDKAGAQYATTQQKREEEVRKAREQGQALIIAGKLTEKELAERIAAIQSKHKDKSPARVGGDTELANIAARVAAEERNLELLRTQGVAAEKLNDGERTALQLTEQLGGQLDAKTRKSKEAQLVQARALGNVLNQQQAERELQQAKAAAAALDEKLTGQQIGKYQQAIDQLVAGNEQLRTEIDLVGKDTAARREYLALKAQEVITAKELEVINLRNAGERQEVINKAEQDLRLLRDKITLTDQVNSAQDGQAAKDMLDAIQRETIALGQSNEQRQLTIALRELDNKGIKAGSAAYEEYIPKIKAAISGKAVAEQSVAFWGSVEGVARDAWNHIGEQGESAADRIKRALKAGVWDMLWQITGKRWLIDIGASMGVPGAALAQSQQSAGGVGGLQGVAGLKTLYDSVTKGVSGSVTAGFETLVNNTVGEKLGLSYYNGTGYETTGTGQTLGQYAGVAGNALAGYGLQKAISGGYKTGESGLVDAITVAASAYFGPIAGVAAGVFNRAFGTKFVGAGVEGVFGGSAGFIGSNYADYKGGWFRSDKTTRSDLDPALATGLADGYKTLQANVSDMGKTLGLGSKAVDTYNRKIRVSTAGLTQDQIVNRLQEEFAELGDEMAQLVLGTSAYSTVGESSLDALTRLSKSLIGVNATFRALGRKLYDDSLDGARMASSLADVFGGLGAVASTSAAYFQSYYSEADQAKLRTANLTAELSTLGLSLPITKDGFRALVDSLDLTTASGQATYAKLLLLAPEFEAVADLNAKLAADQLKIAQDNGARIAAELLATFGGQTLSSALDGHALSIAALTSNATASTSALNGTSTSLSTINRVLSDASSGTLTFGSQLDAVTTALDPAQMAVVSLQGAVDDLKLSANGSITDMAGLTQAIGEASAAAGGFESQAFAATFVDTIAGVFETIGARVKDTIGQIAAERQAVREAAIAILDPSAKTGAQISAELAGVRVAGVDNSALIAAESALATQQNTVSWWTQRVATLAGEQSAAQSVFDRLYSDALVVKADVDAAANSYGVYFNSQSISGGAYDTRNTAGVDIGGGRLSTNDYWSSSDTAGYETYRDSEAVWDGIGGGWISRNMGNDSQTLSGFINASNAAWDTLNAAATQHTDAGNQAAAQKALLTSKEQAAAQAALDYTAALQQYSVSSSKAVSQLGRLREETVAYYQSQKQLADGMSSGAATLRQTIADYNFSQLSSADQARELQERFNTAYSLALNTTGETLMGYGQQLNDLVNPLLQTAQESGMSSTEYSALVSTVLARGEAVAQRLDDLAPKDYQAESLGLLGSIDSVLASLDAGAKSADQLIVDALNASKDASRAGFAAVVAALTGAAIPAFASGGYYGGGVALVGEKGPELINFSHPGQIYTAEQTASLLSPKQALAGSGAGMANAFAAMARQIEALSKEVTALRLENRQFGTAIATNTGKSARLADRWDGDGLPIRSAEDTTLAVAAA